MIIPTIMLAPFFIAVAGIEPARPFGHRISICRIYLILLHG